MIHTKFHRNRPVGSENPLRGEGGEVRWEERGVGAYIGFGRYHISILFKFGSKMLISFQVIANLKFSKSLKITPRGVGGGGGVVSVSEGCVRYPLSPF